MPEAILGPAGPSPAGELNLRHGARLWEQLKAQGLAHLAICPGSRSAPLALSAWGRPGLACSVHLDERAAAFLALGVARRTGRLAAVLTTSGTAAANLAPAAAEARRSGLPLLLITADRPPLKRLGGASQVIPQVGLFGELVQGAWDLPLPVEGTLEPWAALVAEAAAKALGPEPGPVHLNVPLDEPLWPPPGLDLPRLELGQAGPEVPVPQLAPPSCPPGLGRAWEEAQAPVLILGPDAWPLGVEAEPFLAWAEAAGLPILLEGTSRWPQSLAKGLVRRTDALLAKGWPPGGPDLILRAGLAPVGKRLERSLASATAPQAHLMPDGRAHEALGRARWRLQGPWWKALPEWPTPQADLRRKRQRWARTWLEAQAHLEGLETTHRLLDRHPEARWVQAALAASPPGATVLVGNSLMVRHLEAFGLAWGHPGPVLGIRGAAGIDGVTAQAVGAAMASAGPTLLLTGDVSFLHDLNALLAGEDLALAGGQLVVVVINNDGGGIFQLLPVAKSAPAEAFERLFGTPHGRALAPLARAMGVEAARMEDLDLAQAWLAEAWAGGPGLRVLELPGDRQGVEAALAEALGLWRQAWPEEAKA